MTRRRHGRVRLRRPRRRGVAFLYVIVAMTVLIGFTSLAVDLARVQVSKTQLQVAADAAARAGALALPNAIYGVSAAPSTAAAAAAVNRCDGSAVVLDTTSDVAIGYWVSATRTFIPVTDVALANAVRVTARRTAARGTAIPLLFLKVVGRSTCDVQAQSTALLTRGKSVSPDVSAKCNPFLAGQPPGTSASNGNPHDSPDWSYLTPGKTNSSPQQANLPLTPGQTMTFDGVNGSATYDPNVAMVSADGNTSYVVTNSAGAEHGISNLKAPINSIVAVFVNDDVPGGTAPADLDFSTTASRDFTTLSPKLNQTFFIGDGRTGGGTVQQFVVPAGATRLFIGDMDGYEWNNNSGTFSLTVHSAGHVTTVY